MVDPIITPAIVTVVTQFVTSEPFKEFALSAWKGVGTEFGKSIFTSVNNQLSQKNNSDNINSGY